MSSPLKLHAIGSIAILKIDRFTGEQNLSTFPLYYERLSLLKHLAKQADEKQNHRLTQRSRSVNLGSIAGFDSAHPDADDP